MDAKRRYMVANIAQNQWFVDSDGRRRTVIERDCGHAHRTITGLARCMHTLCKPTSDGMRRADFYHAAARTTEGERLTDQEIERLYDIQTGVA